MAEKVIRVLQSEQAPKAIGPYSAGIQADQSVFCSGQLGLDPQSGELVSGGIEAQTRQAIQNLEAVLRSAGASLSDVVKTTVFLQDMAEFSQMNAVYAEFFLENPPARSTIQVAALPKGGAVEIDAIAVLPGEG